MDPAVGLVRAYLQLNGFFTVTEYPIVEAIDPASAYGHHAGGFKATTDLDVLAVRFPGAGHLVAASADGAGEVIARPDPALDNSDERLEFIIGEVKQGRAELNRAGRDPRVLEAALTRFGAFNREHLPELVRQLLANGEALTRQKRARVRLFAFGSVRPDKIQKGVTVLTLGHMIAQIRGVLSEHQDKFMAVDLKDDALAMLALLEKSRA